MSGSTTQRILWVLWPSFLVAAAAELLVFAVIDPADLHLFGVPVDAGRMPVYTIGFFFFWALGAASAALTVFLQRSPVEVNRCPLDADDRPAGCAKQAGAQDAAG
ncbi:MAG: hypothetical protein IPM30_09820 [Burkholderiales bacterium]|jgi:hypothetical protein|nr:hypothetical protein [Burkholderiales bacterium]